MLKAIALMVSLLVAGTAQAADATVEMHNKLGKETMVFSEKIVYVDPGDTVTWKAVDKGHNVEFIDGGVPAGIGEFRSKTSKDAEYKFETPGIYAYWCTPHKSMGMIAFVVVGGDKSNLDAVKAIKYKGKSKKVAKKLIAQLSE